MVAARRRFPNGAPVALVWGAGIRSPGGVDDATSRRRCAGRRVPRSPPSCPASARTPRGAAPRFRPMRVRFSAPVALVEAASRAVLIGPDDRRWTPEPPEGEDWTVEAADLRGRRSPRRRRSGSSCRPTWRDDAGRGAGERRQLSARRADRRRAAARQVRRPLRHHRGEGRPHPPGHRAQPGARGGRAAAARRRPRRAAFPPPRRSRWLRRVAVSPRNRSVFAGATTACGARPIKLPRTGRRRAIAEVIGIPLGEPGLYVVELASARLGAALHRDARPALRADGRPRDEPVGASQVGPRGVARLGDDARRAAPVAGARVSVTDCTGDGSPPATTDADGRRALRALPDRGGAAVLRARVARGRSSTGGRSRALRGLDGGLSWWRSRAPTSAWCTRRGTRASSRSASTCRRQSWAGPDRRRTRCSIARSSAPARRCT